MWKNQVIFGKHTFFDNRLFSGRAVINVSPISETLEVNTLTLDVLSADESITKFDKDTPVQYFYNGRKLWEFYVQKVRKVGKVKYRITANSLIGKLVSIEHSGGVYTGQTVKEVIDDICGNVPHYIKTSLRGIQLYGYLPIASARDNLAAVLYAVGAYLKTDLNGCLRIESLYTHPSSYLTSKTTFVESSETTDDPITHVSVTEHQYIQVEGTSEQTLFDGVSSAGYPVKFSSPMYDLRAEGISILEAHPNYAILSEGGGRLFGKAYTHVTREVTRKIADSTIKNPKSSKNNTLISFTNSSGLLDRMEAYMIHNSYLNLDFVHSAQEAGCVVSAVHPYDSEGVEGFMSSVEYSIGGFIRATGKVTPGFIPARTEQNPVVNKREVLTGSGVYIVPEGVTRLTGVLFSGGEGGWSGLQGELSEQPNKVNNVGFYGKRYELYNNGFGGNGGQPGEPGKGGKFLQFEMEVTPGQEIPYSSGVGGKGGVFSSEGSVQGQKGTDTTFGDKSSSTGVESDVGFADVTTGQVYGAIGKIGIAGGDAPGWRGEELEPDEPWGDREFVEGSVVVGRDGRRYTPGASADRNDQIKKEDSNEGGTVLAIASRPGGGGAAVGSNGNDYTSVPDPSVYIRVRSYSSQEFMTAVVSGCVGANGANAAKPETPGNLGMGGFGGNGGGGAGAPGAAYSSLPPDTTISDIEYNYNSNLSETQSGQPGQGSDGGDGAPGGILLFYSIPVKVSYGQVICKGNKILLDRLGRRFTV